jgi:hypothetical protein
VPNANEVPFLGKRDDIGRHTLQAPQLRIGSNLVNEVDVLVHFVEIEILAAEMRLGIGKAAAQIVVQALCGADIKLRCLPDLIFA